MGFGLPFFSDPFNVADLVGFVRRPGRALRTGKCDPISSSRQNLTSYSGFQRKDASMTRSSLFLAIFLIAAVVVGSLSLGANRGGDNDQSIENALAAQRAVLLARDYLLRAEAKKAVDVLEGNLAHSNGDRRYLALLRDAYRSYINDPALANQPAQAEIYRKRLQILEDQETSQQLAAGASNAPQNVTTPPAMAQVPAPQAANPTPVTSGERAGPQGAAAPGAAVVPKTATPPTNAAATAAVRLQVDPFDTAFEQKFTPSPISLQQNVAKQLVARAEEEFLRKQYAVAKQLYEQAYQADTKAFSNESRGQWAYCQLQLVVEQANRYPEQPCDWVSLEADVKTAVTAAPHLAKTGEMILGELAKRRKTSPSVIRSVMPSVAVTHKERGTHGWLVAETTNFRILHNTTKEFAENAAQAAEFTRSQMSRKWFGKDGDDWTPKCDIYLYTNASEYNQHTGQPATSPGHSRIDLDPSYSRIVLRQVHLRCDNAALLEAVLPHETTHVVLAGHFGNKHVPRWVDEGVAVMTEPQDKVDQHKKNLAKSLQNHELIPLRDLLQMDSYPCLPKSALFMPRAWPWLTSWRSKRGRWCSPSLCARHYRAATSRPFASTTASNRSTSCKTASRSGCWRRLAGAMEGPANNAPRLPSPSGALFQMRLRILSLQPWAYQGTYRSFGAITRSSLIIQGPTYCIVAPFHPPRVACIARIARNACSLRAMHAMSCNDATTSRSAVADIAICHALPCRLAGRKGSSFGYFFSSLIRPNL